MSLDRPDRPSRPDSRCSNRLMSSALRPSCCSRYSTTAASSRPQRVPIGRPSSGEKLIVVATDSASTHRAHRRPVAQVGDDDAALRAAFVGRHQLRTNRLVRQAMKTVAPHARVVQRLRQRETLVDVGLRAVKGGVEAGHLRHTCKRRARRAHARQVVRLVQRRERLQRGDRGLHRIVDEHRLLEARCRRARCGGPTAQTPDVALVGAHPGQDGGQCVAVCRAVLPPAASGSVMQRAPCALRIFSVAFRPRPSACPTTVGAARSPSASNSANLIDDDPALRVRRWSRTAVPCHQTRLQGMPAAHSNIVLVLVQEAHRLGQAHRGGTGRRVRACT